MLLMGNIKRWGVVWWCHKLKVYYLLITMRPDVFVPHLPQKSVNVYNFSLYCYTVYIDKWNLQENIKLASFFHQSLLLQLIIIYKKCFSNYYHCWPLLSMLNKLLCTKPHHIEGNGIQHQNFKISLFLAQNIVDLPPYESLWVRDDDAIEQAHWSLWFKLWCYCLSCC